MCAIAFFAKYWAITFLIKKGQVVSQMGQGVRMMKVLYLPKISLENFILHHYNIKKIISNSARSSVLIVIVYQLNSLCFE